jgi:gamma-glutamylputrescine oxidase
VFPELADARIDYAWSGWIGIGINRMPQLGRLADNVAYIQAYSGHGVAPTHIMARITAEMIAEGDQTLRGHGEDQAYGLSPGAGSSAAPAWPIGMAYYKALDLL